MEIKKIFRLHDWWSHILPPIFMFSYWGFFEKNNSVLNAIYIILYLLLITNFTAIIGFFINDLFDESEDKIVGKYNFTAQLPLFIKILFLPLFLILFFILIKTFSFLLSTDVLKITYSFVFMSILLFALYSAPQIRLKNKPFLALIIDAIYSGTLFYFLAYVISEMSSIKPAILMSDIRIWLILGWGYIKGLRNYLTHVVEDYDNDIKTGTLTLSIKYGKLKIQKAANYLFPIEIGILFYFSTSQKYILFCWMFGFLYGFLLIKWYLSEQRKKNRKIERLNDYYEIWSPFLVLLQLIFLHRNYYPLLILHTILFPQYLNKLYFYTLFKLIGPIRKNGNN